MSTQSLSPQLHAHALSIAELEKEREQARKDLEREYSSQISQSNKHLHAIQRRLEHSVEVIKNLDKKRFHMYGLRNLRFFPRALPYEFQWLRGNKRYHMLSFTSSSTFQAGLHLRNEEDSSIKYEVHPIFYTGSTHEISSFARKIFYREQLSRIGKSISNAEFRLHAYLNFAGHTDGQSLIDIDPLIGSPQWGNKTYPQEEVIKYYSDIIEENTNALIKQSSKYAQKLQKSKRPAMVPLSPEQKAKSDAIKEASEQEFSRASVKRRESLEAQAEQEGRIGKERSFETRERTRQIGLKLSEEFSDINPFTFPQIRWMNDYTIPFNEDFLDMSDSQIEQYVRSLCYEAQNKTGETHSGAGEARETLSEGSE